MADNKSKKEPQDASKVNVNQDYEVRYWCAKFNCTQAMLKRAVNNVGVSAVKVAIEVARLKRLK